MTKRLHNPKSHAPAVYIPCWLIQVPIKLLSLGAKITYGRLSQWSNEKGIVFRSAKQLADELGTSYRSIEDYIKELKEASLIGTYQPQAGGVNHFEFYQHPWMDEPINENLVYKSNSYTPPQDSVVPPTGFCGTPPQDSVVINIKEIKETKHTHTEAGIEQNLYLESEQQRKAVFFRKECFKNNKCRDLYELLPEDTKNDKSFEDVYEECLSHYATESPPRLISPQRLISWIKRDIVYSKKELESKKDSNHKKKSTGTDKFNEMMTEIQKKNGVIHEHNR